MPKNKFFQIVPSETNIDFVGKYHFFVTLSVLLILGTFALISVRGFNFGIDFTGGTVMQIRLKEPMPIDQVRALVTEAGAPDASVVSMGTAGNEYLITSRTSEDSTQHRGLADTLRNKIGADKVEIPQVDVVGPKVGSELKTSAVLAMFYSILLIMIYIWFRFDFKFAPGATAALIHDLILTCGFYSLTGMEFDITAVAALLTIAGYSVNDTIVIYDRVRSLLAGANLDSQALSVTVNKALNLTLSRTLLTSGCTALSVIPVAIFCEGPIQAFAKAVLFGLVIGSYSTIYIAAPMTISVQKWFGHKLGGRPVTKRA
jgi:preprotein translocase subunit SecF